MKKKFLFSFAFAMLISLLSFSQEKTITGFVSDNYEPLPGASILVKGTTNGAITDIEGHYSIKVKVGQQLLFNYIGYEPVTLIITDKQSIYNVQLKLSPIQLDDRIDDPIRNTKKQSLGCKKINPEAIRRSIDTQKNDETHTP